MKSPTKETNEMMLGLLLHTSEGRDGWIWSNDRMMVSRVKLKKLRKNLPPCHFVLHECGMNLPGNEPKVLP